MRVRPEKGLDEVRPEKGLKVVGTTLRYRRLSSLKSELESFVNPYSCCEYKRACTPIVVY